MEAKVWTDKEYTDAVALAFKAGMEEEAKGGTNAISYLKGVKEGTQKGVREVVEWLEEPMNRRAFIRSSPQWQAFKKERGL